MITGGYAYEREKKKGSNPDQKDCLGLNRSTLDELTGGFASVESVRPEQRVPCQWTRKMWQGKRKQTHREVPILTILGHPSRDFSNRTHSCTLDRESVVGISRTTTGCTL